eukprot:5144774-Alexandrium_andersonii.AAC.1
MYSNAPIDGPTRHAHGQYHSFRPEEHQTDCEGPRFPSAIGTHQWQTADHGWHKRCRSEAGGFLPWPLDGHGPRLPGAA